MIEQKEYFCEHCKRDLTENVNKNKGIYHVCRGKYFCDECWEFILMNERMWQRKLRKQTIEDLDKEDK